MARFGRGNRSRKRNKSPFVRATALFEVDREYVPKGAKYLLRGRASGEFRDAVAEVIQKAVDDALDIAFSVVKWKTDEYPVLSVGAVEPRRRRDEDDEEEDRPSRRRRGRAEKARRRPLQDEVDEEEEQDGEEEDEDEKDDDDEDSEDEEDEDDAAEKEEDGDIPF